jgi:hypothetical protein
MALPLPHVILFDNVNCAGEHTHICQARTHLGSLFNDRTSSFIILEGVWEFFADVNFQSPMVYRDANGQIQSRLGQGVYNWIEATFGPGTNDRLTSLRPVP